MRGLLWSLVNPHHKQTVQSVDVFFVVCLNKPLNKQSSFPKFEIKADGPLHRSKVSGSLSKKTSNAEAWLFLLAWISCWTNYLQTVKLLNILDQSSLSQTPCEGNPLHKKPLMGEYSLLLAWTSCWTNSWVISNLNTMTQKRHYSIFISMFVLILIFWIMRYNTYCVCCLVYVFMLL